MKEMKNQLKNILVKKQPMLMLSLVIFTLIISGGYLYFQYEKKIIRQERYSDLKTIADLKIDQITKWHEERLSDAHVIAESPFIRQSLQRWLLTQDSTLERNLLERFSLLRHYYKYEDVIMVSDEGKLLLGLNTNLKHIDSETIDYCKKALRDKKTFMSDFYFSPAHETIHLDIYAPVLNDINVPMAVLVLRVNPYDYLYPLIQSWPTSGKSAETLIVRREGDSILFETELRHLSNTALRLRIPLTSIKVPAVQAVLGQVGIYEGVDYRGVKVLTDMRPVPGTPWFMIAKVDQSEIFSELRYRAVIVIIINLLLLLFFGIGISWVYNNRQKNIYRKLLETGTALQASESKYQTLFKNAQVGMYRSKIDGSAFLDVNDRFAKIIGFAPRELIGTPGRIRWAKPEDRDKMMSLLKEQGGILYNYEARVLAKNGEVRDVLASIQLHPDEGFLDGTMIDITERKRLEIELKNSQDLLSKMGKISQIGAWELDVSSMKQIWTDETFEIHDVDKKTYNPNVGRELNSFSPKSKPIIEAAVGDAIRNGNPYDLELEMITVRGTNKMVRAVGFAEKENGEIKRVYGTLQDITERKRTEKALEDERNLLRTVIDLLPSFIFVKDRESRFLVANVACAHFMGTNSPQELIGKSDADFYQADVAIGFRDNELGVLEGIPVVDKEEGSNSPNGTPRNLMTTKLPLRDGEGNIIGLVGASFDITERKQAEEEIKILNESLEQRIIERTSQLEAANKGLEAFAYSVSHDLRAPLRAVDGFSKFVLEDYEDILDSEGKRLLNLIRSNTQKMDQLITDLLALSRVTRNELNFSGIDMTQMAISMFKEIAPDDHDKISLKVDPLPEVFADPTYLRQVWANLIANAIKFSSKEKKPSIKICGRVENGFNVYYVKDNGVGFNPEYTHKLFGVFQRLHRSDDFEGNGVGLAIVQRIINRHGGKVWAESVEGKGATFWFSLPVKGGEEGGGSRESEDGRRKSGVGSRE